MLMRIALLGMFVLALGGAARAQTTNTTEERLNRLERRFDESEQKHQAELKARDEEIARLRAQLDRQPPPLSTPGAPATQDQIEKTKQDILKDIESRDQVLPTRRFPANFNPDLAV